MVEAGFPNFEGKHVLFYCLGKPRPYSYLLQDIAIANFGGRHFVTGRVSDGLAEDTWSRGLPAAFDWAIVERYLVFESAQQYRDRTALWRRKSNRWPWQWQQEN